MIKTEVQNQQLTTGVICIHVLIQPAEKQLDQAALLLALCNSETCLGVLATIIQSP